MREGSGHPNRRVAQYTGSGVEEPRAICGIPARAAEGKGPQGLSATPAREREAGGWGGNGRWGQGTLPPPQLHSRLEQRMRSSRPVPFWPRQPLPSARAGRDGSEKLSRSLPYEVPRRECFLVEVFPGLPIPTDSALVPTMQGWPSLKPVFQTGKLRLREHGGVWVCLALTWGARTRRRLSQ